MIAISLLFYIHWKGSERSLLIPSSHRLFNSLTGYPVIRPAGYPIGYRKRPDIRYNPSYNVYFPWAKLTKNVIYVVELMQFSLLF